MKTSITTWRCFPPRLGAVSLILLASLLPLATPAADIFWTGGTASYTNLANWLGGVVPGATDNAINTNGLGSVVEINVGNPDWTVADLSAGGGPEAAGASVQNGQTLTVNGWLHIGDGSNSIGVYTLNGGIVNVLNGQLFLCEAPGSAGTLNINGGTLNKAGDTFRIADGGWNGSGARTGTVNQVAGTVECASELWVGQVSPGVGFYNLSGTGVINLRNWLAVGRGGGSGTFNVTGGTFNKNNNGAFIIGAGGGTIGVFNHSAGTITCAGEYWLGEGGGSIGTNNISGTAVVNISDWTVVGRGGLGVLNLAGGSFTSTGNGMFRVADGGSTGHLNVTGGSLTVGKRFAIADNGTGLLNQSGGTITANDEVWIGQWHDGVGQFDLSAGTFVANNWLAIGREGADGVLNITGGSLTKQGGGHIPICHGHDGNTASGTVNQSGGDFTCTAGELWIGEDTGAGTYNINGGTASFGYVQPARNASATGDLNLNGGTFTATEITTGSSGTSTLTFNGGTLRAGAHAANFLHDLTTAQLAAGGATIDSAGFNITIAQTLTDGGGSLTKTGAGTLTLTGANSYSGATTINAGKLVTTANSTTAGGYTVANNAGLGVVLPSANAQLNISSLTLSGPAALLEFTLGNFGNPTLAPLNVTGAFDVNGTVTVNIADDLPQIGQFPLVQYASRTGNGSFVIGSLPTGVVASIVTNGNNIELNLTSVNLPRWDGQDGGNWDIGLTTTNLAGTSLFVVTPTEPKKFFRLQNQ